MESDLEARSSRVSSLPMDARSRDVLDCARDAVLIVDASGTILDANSSAGEIYGYPLHVLIGMSISDLRTRETRTGMQEQLGAALQGGILFEAAHLRSDGSTFPVEVSSRGVDLAHGRGVVSVIRDITRRRHNEAERERLISELATSNQHLEGLLRIVSGALDHAGQERLLAETLETLAEVVDADAVVLLERDQDALVVTYQRGASSWAPTGLRVPEEQGFAARIAEAGKPIYVASLSESPWRMDILQSAGIRSVFGVPMFLGGSLFGVLELAWWSQHEVSVAQSTMIQLAASRITLAVANARLFERSRKVQVMSTALNELNVLVNGSLHLTDMLNVPAVLAIVAEGLDCESVAFGTVDEATLTITYSHGLDRRRSSVLLTLEAVKALELGDSALATGGWVDIPGFEDGSAHPRPRKMLAVPVEARGERFGVMLLGDSEERRLDELTLEYAKRFADVIAQALANSEDFASEHRIAETLQEALLTVPASVRGVAFEHLYRSATVNTRVGGDFYDWFELARGRVGLVIGDVSGKGLEAAILTSVIKDTIRAYAHETSSPAVVMKRVNHALGRAARLPEFASAFFAVINTRDGEMTYCSAGHPPAVVLGKDGSARLLPGASPIIGVSDDMEYKDQRLVLGRDETVVLYTDGVTESRDGDGRFFGEDGLIFSLEAAVSSGANELPSVLMDDVTRFADGRLSDDIAIVSLRLA
ncbi:MAG: SpoIIE family protein phosphatase [Coriobacteriia bacterium]|nr:SpoIIE family protein phosphatase [Coriobacteriia bacterium]